jgi:predicted transcriptional regulator
MNHAFISIKPQHVENILLGKKTVELRTVNLNLKPTQILWIYATVPIASVVAVASVQAVFRLPSARIWRSFQKEICISKSEFDTYTGSREEMTAIQLMFVQKLANPMSLEKLRLKQSRFQPPQVITYLDNESSILSALRIKYKELEIF